jgi:hypothetical protein
MKLAEALADRADLQRRVEQMRMRLQASARVQEDEIPPEDPRKLLEGYVRRINGTPTSPRRSPTARRRSRTPWRAATP